MLSAVATFALIGAVIVPVASDAQPAAAAEPAAAAATTYHATYNIPCGDTAELVRVFKEITGGTMTDVRTSWLIGSGRKNFNVVLAANCTYNFSKAYDGANALAVVGGDITNKVAMDSPLVETVVLDGNGSTFARTGSAPFRFLAVNRHDSTLTVNNLTMIGGQAPDGTHVANHEWWKYAISITAQVVGAIVTAGASSLIQSQLQIAVALPAIIKVASALNTVRKGIMATVNDVGDVTPGGNGGAIASDGALTLNGVTFQSNRAGDGGNGADATGQDGAGGGSGGAVFVSPVGSLDVTDSTFTGNKAGAGGTGSYGATPFTGGGGTGGDGGDGGAIASYGAAVIKNSMFQANLAGGAGAPGKDWGVATRGGQYGDGGAVVLGPTFDRGENPVTAKISGSSFIGNGNLAGRGGAIASTMGAKVLVENTTLQNNRASRGGTLAALDTYGFDGGNAIDLRNSVVTDIGSDNTGDFALATNGNTINVANSVLFGLSSPPADTCAVTGTGTITTHTFFTGDDSDAECVSERRQQQAMLPLTPTSIGRTVAYLPQPGSELIDAGDEAYCAKTDQRGLPRKAGSCDVGTIDHFEWAATSLGTIYKGIYASGAEKDWPWQWGNTAQWFIDNGYLVASGAAGFDRVMSGSGSVYFYVPPKIDVSGAGYVIKTFSGSTRTEISKDHNGNPITDPFLVPLTFAEPGTATVELWVVSNTGDQIKLDTTSFPVGNSKNVAPTVTITPQVSAISDVNQYSTHHFSATVSDPDAGATWALAQTPTCGPNATLSNLTLLDHSFEFDCTYGAGASSFPYPKSRISASVIDDQGATSAAFDAPNPSIVFQPAQLRSTSSRDSEVVLGGAPQTMTFTLVGDNAALRSLAANPAAIGMQHCGTFLTGPVNAKATVDGTTLTGSFECLAQDSRSIGKSYAGGAATWFSLEGGFKSSTLARNYSILAPVTASVSSPVFYVENDGFDNAGVTLGPLNLYAANDVSFSSLDWGDGTPVQNLGTGWVPGSYGHEYTKPGTYTIKAYAYVNSLGENVPVWSKTVYSTRDAQPVLTTPGNLTLSNASAASATLHYQASATDPLKGTRAIGCSVGDGAVLPVGTTTVTCSADNGQRYPWYNTGAPSSTTSSSFTVTVKDVVAPVLGVPTVTQTVNDGATTVDYVIPTTDDSATSLVCDVPSGSVLLAGVTTVTCTATDAANNASSLSFLVNVGEGAPPTIAVPGELSANSTNGGSVAVTYAVSATDQADAAVTPTCLPASGALFAPGVTTVSCSATDGNGNWGTATFPVTVYGGTVANWNDLQAQFSRGGQVAGGQRTNAVKLAADLSFESDSNGGGQALRLAAGDNVTLDLAGHALSIDAPAGAAAIEVPSGASLTIVDTSVTRSGDLTLRAQGGGAAIGGPICRSAGTVVIGAGVHGTAVSAGGDAVGGGAAIGAGAALTADVLANWHLDAASLQCDRALSGGSVSFVGSAYGDSSPTSAGSLAGSTSSAPGAAISWVAPATGQSREAIWPIAATDTGDDGGIGFGPSGWLNVHLEGGSTADALGGPLAVPSQVAFTRASQNPADLGAAVDTNPGVDDPSREGQLFGGWRKGSATGDAWTYDRLTADTDPASQRNVDVYASWIEVTGTGADQQFVIPGGANALLDLRGRLLKANANNTADGPGVSLPVGATLTIADTVGSGSLTAGAGRGAAGIGGAANEGAGTLVVAGGQITAKGFGGAGVGGGAGGAGGSVELRGGTLVADSFGYTADGFTMAAGAAVGAGVGAASGSGGTVTAYGQMFEGTGGSSLPTTGGGAAGLAASFSLVSAAAALWGDSAPTDGPAYFVAQFGYPVTFHLDGGRVPSSAAPYDVEDGDILQARERGGDLQWISESSPEKQDAVFAGWFTDAAFTAPIDLRHTVLSGPLDVYAKWATASDAVTPDGDEPTIAGFPARMTGVLTATVPSSWNGGTVTPEIHYEWQRNSIPIRDAEDAATYTAKFADIGKFVSVRITATAPGLAPYERTVDGATVGKAEYLLDNGGATVYGDGWNAPASGDTLSLINLGWKSWDGVTSTATTPGSVRYVWKRDGVAIDGAASKPSYTATPADIDTALSVTVIAAGPGHDSYSFDSDTSPVVRSRVLPTPATPTISATCAPIVDGCALTPVVENLGQIAGLQLTYRWYVGQPGQQYTEIPGSTSTTPVADPYRKVSYSVRDQYVPAGSKVQISVTATAPGYVPVTVYSAQDAVTVDGKRFTAVGPASIQNLDRNLQTSSARPGDRLVALPLFSSPTTTPWTASSSYTYEWFVTDRDGANPQSVSTDRQIRVSAEWGGKNILVRVTSRAPGYYSETATSPVLSLPETVRVRFDANGGSAVADGGALQGQSVSRPADPTLAGYAFAGWYEGDRLFDFAQVITLETTLTAHWTRLTSTIDSWDTLVASFAAVPTNGTTTTFHLWTDVTGDSGTGHLVLAAGAKVVLNLNGHQLSVGEFDGDLAAIGVEPGAQLTLQDTVGGGALTATTTTGGAGIGGRSGGSSGDIVITSGSVYAASATGASIGAGEGGASGGSLTIAGAAVNNSAIAAPAGGAPVPAITRAGTPSGAYTAYAVSSGVDAGGSYTSIDYGVPVHIDLGSSASYSAVGLPAFPFYLGDNPTRAGFTFAGWYSDADRSLPVTLGDDGYGPIATITGETTFYAKWIAEPVIAVDGGGGECTKSTVRAIVVGQFICATVPGQTVTFDGYAAGVPSWSLDGTPVTFQWFVDGQPVDANAGAGAQSPQYRVGAAELGRDLTVSVNGTAVSGTAFSAVSEAARVNAAASLSAPTISGQPSVGETLTVDPGHWTTQPATWGYTWCRDGVAIADATGADYVLTDADGGHAITARVTWRNAAGVSIDATSAKVEIPEPFVSIRFDSAGGSAVADMPVAPGTLVVAPPNPTRTGYEFAGWYDGEVAFDFTQVVSSGRTLTAHWTAAKITVTFDANGGSGTLVSQPVDYGTATALTANAFTRDHYTFSGWNTAADGSGTAYADRVSYPFTEAATLYAQWAPVTYVVTFNANGGTGAMPAQSKAYDGSASPLTSNALTRSGYSFAGWNTAADGSGTSYADAASYPFAGSVTLYAQWAPVTCDPGSSSWSATYFGGKALAGPAVAVQCLTRLDEVFGSGVSPLAAVPVTNYSARFTRTVEVEEGTYAFTIAHDDGARVFVDGVSVYDVWGVSGSKSVAVPLGAGAHDVVVEYNQGGGAAKLRFDYRRVPQADCDAGLWSATYFGGKALAGPAVAVQCLTRLDEVFGSGVSPLAAVPVTNYSARFTRTVEVEEGTYAFTIAHDDGARVFVDGVSVYDVWGVSGSKSVAVPLGAGAHDVVVEYNQGGGAAKLRFDYRRVPQADCDAGLWAVLACR